ncbi:hypothetical protein RH915_09050 [Serpentinicella sp. ANB-PHB4]|uniref:hypothetical protein n=1 Tax=Serpentinicella sp. ANB-PHB4 TaxID=3074076 RepID=UPI00285D70DC|nr:hypothetical protein [Serpentinicella sp. ANB-PHB4]MDR5659641.1 hypothetical protein [Serpentinicella sp. ANB-PHB4]
MNNRSQSAKILIFTLIFTLILSSSAFANNGRGNGRGNAAKQPGPPSHARAVGLQRTQTTPDEVANVETTAQVNTLALEENDEILDEDIISELDKEVQEANEEVQEIDEVKDVIQGDDETTPINEPDFQDRQPKKAKSNNGLNGLQRAIHNVRHTPAFDVISRLIELRGGTVELDDTEIVDDESVEDKEDQDIVEQDSKEQLPEDEIVDEKQSDVEGIDKELKVEDNSDYEEKDTPEQNNEDLQELREVVQEAIQTTFDSEEDVITAIENLIVLLNSFI